MAVCEVPRVAETRPMAAPPAARLYVGGDCAAVGGERVDLVGDRCFSARDRAQLRVSPEGARGISALLDSGAFGDPPDRRLTPETALARQLAWERRAGARWGDPNWRAHALVSYDRLIDETWTADGTRHKRRWSVRDAERAVEETVDAAAYLAGQRAALAPRRLVLSCQGVDAGQYAACAAAVLAHARPGDWVGLGGWCILGRWTSWLPTFYATLWSVLPMVAAAGVDHVHLFGVLYRPALGPLVWLADQHGLSVSTDSSAPLLSARFTTARAAKKAGMRGTDWRSNVAWWTRELADLRMTPYYHAPPRVPAVRQPSLFDD